MIFLKFFWMNNAIEFSALNWMNIFLNEYFGFCFEWIFFWMNILDFVLNCFWIESFLGRIQWKNEFSKRIEQGYCKERYDIENNLQKSSMRREKLQGFLLPWIDPKMISSWSIPLPSRDYKKKALITSPPILHQWKKWKRHSASSQQQPLIDTALDGFLLNKINPGRKLTS